jgi:POT family proton-dependent oligopeptide transporter
LTVFGIVILFWMSFYQNGFTLTLWARDATGPILGYVIPPETFQSVNPLFIVILTPVLVGIWSALRARGREPSTPVKMLIGMLATAAAFAIMAGAGFAGGDTGLVSPLWLVASYAAISVAELCLSPMGLSLVSRVAPERIRGLMMGLWFGATAAGGYLSGAIEPLWNVWAHSTFFGFLVGTSLFAALLLVVALPFLRRATRTGP